MTMGLLLIILLVLAVLAMSSWGYSSYAYRPATVVAEPAVGPSPIISIIGVLGLLALIAFFVLWAVEGWHFNFEAIPPR